MGLEAHFTLKGTENEIPFTIVSGSTENEWVLFSINNNLEIRYPLKNDHGLLRLSEIENPFEENSDTINERLAGLSGELIESRSQGFENTGDFDFEHRPGYGPEQIFVENKPFSLRQLYDLINEGEIELTPDFQRNFIWDKTRQSRLIESILLGLPLPSIYLSQYTDGTLTVVDGLQRLSTIKEFFEDKLVLNNLEYLIECNGMVYSKLKDTLSPLRMRKFGQTQILCFVIDYRSPNELKFDLFKRLNTGGRPLNNQEIRNCLTRPRAQVVIKRMIELPSFKRATENSVKDTRMEAREAVMRFIYFYTQYTEENPVGIYNGDMETTLNNFVDEINSWSEERLRSFIPLYDRALQNAYHLFGNYCFRKVTNATLNSRRSPVNKLLMLTLSVLLSKYETEDIQAEFPSKYLLAPLAECIGSTPNLFNAITWGTNAKFNIELGFNAFKSLLNQHLIFQE